MVTIQTAKTPKQLIGWPMVERRLDQAQEQFRTARVPDDYAAVGDACAEILLLLVQAVYALDREQFGNTLKVRLDQSLFNLLDAYIAQKLTGASKDAARANLNLANSSNEARTGDAQSAKLRLTAIGSVVELLSISSGRLQSRDTVADLCDRFIREKLDLGTSHAYSIQALKRMPIGKRVASEITAEDVVAHAKLRRSANISPATITQDVIYLRGVIAEARDAWNLEVSTDPIDHAKRDLLKSGVMGRSNPRDRRPTRAELQSLVNYFEEYQAKPKGIRMPMKDIMEFALWSARPIGEICALRWEDLDKIKRTCKTRITDARGNVRTHEFPLLGKAFDIVVRQPRTDKPEIFPYNAKSAGAAYTIAKRRLGIENLKFQDLRREAAIRLYEAGNSIEQIAKVTGRMELNTLLRDIGAGSSSGAMDGGTALEAALEEKREANT